MSPLNTRLPRPLSSRYPTAGTVWFAGIGVISRPSRITVRPTAISSKRMNGASGVGISVKSGQIDQLKMWLRRISIVARVA